MLRMRRIGSIGSGSCSPIRICVRRLACVIALHYTRSSRIVHGGRSRRRAQLRIQGILARGLSIATGAVSVGHSLLQHPVVIAHDGSQLAVQVEKGVMLTHRLAVGASQLRSEGTNGLVKLLDLRFTQNRARRLMLQPVNQCGEEVDILCLHRGKLKLGIWPCSSGGGGSGGRLSGL